MSKKTGWYLFLIFPYFKPDIISELLIFGWFEKIYDIWKLVSFSIILLLFLLKRKINSFVLSVFVFFGYIFMITILRQGNYQNMLVQEGSMLAVCLLVSLSCDKEELKYLLFAFKGLFAFYLLINAITVFIYAPQGGMYVSDIYLDNIKRNNYFLGYDNKHVNYIIPYLSVSIMSDKMYYKHIRIGTIIMHIVINFAAIMSFPVTTLIAISIFYILMLCMEKDFFWKFINSFTICIGNMLIFYLLIFLRIYNILSELIMTVFHKDLSIARERIWLMYLNAVSRHSITGYGYLTSTGRVAKAGIVHAHNMYLDVLFEAGLIGIILYIFVIFLATNGGKKIIYKEQKIIVIAIIAYMITFQAEAFRYCPSFFILLAFSYELGRKKYCDSLAKEGILRK